jgi:8-oxo-dGTP pyrophosphatase MutT (NUDIX family)
VVGDAGPRSLVLVEASLFSRQSAVIPYRKTVDSREVLLITSRRRFRWIVPKGVIEPGMDAAASACKEAYEEAGILGTVSAQPVGRYVYEKRGRTVIVTVFLMEVLAVLDVWPESRSRRRRWASVEAAAREVEQPALERLIRCVLDA